jgi:hypothetical protein
VPGSCIEVGLAAFSGDGRISALIYESGVRRIGAEQIGFYDSSALSGVSIPATVTNLSATAFYGTSAKMRFHVSPGSAGEAYARDRRGLVYGTGYDYLAGDYAMGDLSGTDRAIDVADLLYLAAGISNPAALGASARGRADVNADSAVDVLDLTVLAKYITGESAALPAV